MDQQLKQLMKELGDAINESLADSDSIAEVVSRIKEGGYDIFLVLEATIGVSKPGEKSPDKTSLVTTLSSNPELKVSDQDLKFLKSLHFGISVSRNTAHELMRYLPEDHALPERLRDHRERGVRRPAADQGDRHRRRVQPGVLRRHA